MSPPYLDKLSPEQQEVFKLLKRFGKKFVLAGGTAIMLQIGHRVSYDFDCFSNSLLPKNLLRRAKEVFGSSIILKIQMGDQITITTKSGVDVTFVYFPYRALRKPINTDSLPLFHLDDLVANKAYTIGRRGVWRDYIDLFSFLKRDLYSLEKIIALAEKKFEGEFNQKLFLGQLVYFRDLDIIPIEFIKEKPIPHTIKLFLEKQVEEYLRKKLPG